MVSFNITIEWWYLSILLFWLPIIINWLRNYQEVNMFDYDLVGFLIEIVGLTACIVYSITMLIMVWR